MNLNWAETGQDSLEARGRSCTYLLAWNERMIVLTRYGSEYYGPGRHGREADAASVARQAALTAMQVPVEDGPSRRAAIAWARNTAETFESGLDVIGQPAWQHKQKGSIP